MSKPDDDGVLISALETCRDEITRVAAERRADPSTPPSGVEDLIAGMAAARAALSDEQRAAFDAWGKQRAMQILAEVEQARIAKPPAKGD